MVIRRRKKVVRQRGSGTHGWGSKKKHRGAGSRGGRGNAGRGKRGEQNKPSIWKNTKYLGKYGFKIKKRKNVRSINVSDIEKGISTKFDLKEKSGFIVVNLKELGYDKLLGSGKVTKKFKITASSASKSAVEKINKAGGEVILPKEALASTEE